MPLPRSTAATPSLGIGGRGECRGGRRLRRRCVRLSPREEAATARVSLLRELASAGNSAGLDVAPSYSRGRGETSRTEPNAPLELAQPDIACSASGETKKLEPIFGLHYEMDEFRRLKVMYPTASSRELAEFQVFAKAVAPRREDGRGSEDRGEDNREDTGDDHRRGRHSQQELQGPPRAPPPWPTFCRTQVTTTKQMVRDAFARAETEERSGQSGRQVLEGLLHGIKRCSSCRLSKFPRRFRSQISCLSCALQ